MTSTRDDAEARRDRLTQHADANRIDVEAAYRGLDWLVLGYSTWRTYCEKVMGMQPKVSAEARDAAIRAMAEIVNDLGGRMSVRDIALSASASPTVVQRVLAKPAGKPVAEVGTASRAVPTGTAREEEPPVTEPLPEKPKRANQHAPMDRSPTYDEALEYRRSNKINYKTLKAQFGLRDKEAREIAVKVRGEQGDHAGARRPEPARKPVKAPAPPTSSVGASKPSWHRSQALYGIRDFQRQAKTWSYTNALATDVQNAIDADDQKWLRETEQKVRDLAMWANRIAAMMHDDGLRASLVDNTDEREDMGTLKPFGLRAV